jgi:hypothetical protein
MRAGLVSDLFPLQWPVLLAAGGTQSRPPRRHPWGERNFKYILKVAHAPSRGRNFEMGRAGPAAPVLPEWIWLSVESPELSQRGAIAHINNLLAVSGVPPIKRSYYQRHAARRKAQRLGLGSEEPAVKRPSRPRERSLRTPPTTRHRMSPTRHRKGSSKVPAA